jgi:hypothetical protein
MSIILEGSLPLVFCFFGNFNIQVENISFDATSRLNIVSTRGFIDPIGLKVVNVISFGVFSFLCMVFLFLFPFYEGSI